MNRLQHKVVRNDAFLRQAMGDYGPMVLRLALAQTGSIADAEDVYQDVFVQLACDQTEFKSREHLKAWLLRVTINRSRDLMRSWWRRSSSSLDALEAETPSEDIGPEDRLLQAVACPELWNAVRRLPQKYRAVVHLHYVEELPTKAIADACGVSESTVRTRLSRAHQKLRTMLGGSLWPAI